VRRRAADEPPGPRAVLATVMPPPFTALPRARHWESRTVCRRGLGWGWGGERGFGSKEVATLGPPGWARYRAALSWARKSHSCV
jgi:hypothetical protein